MTAPTAETTATAILPPLRDGRLLPYSLITLGGLVTALLAGQPALAALAVPFALALALGLRRTGPVEVTARILLDSDQVLEGDRVTGRLALEWSGDLDAEVMLHRLKGVAPAEAGTLSWSLPSGTPRADLPIALRATQWGRHEACEVWVRLGTQFGLLSWTGKVVAGPTLRVLPEAERLNRLLDPPDSRAVWGVHRSRRLGDGHEFAELRPYAPGDRVRDLNWTATARYGRPFVNRYHPDLAGEVVIALDAFADGSTGSAEALSRAARSAWALASVHLRANDRVGLAGLGGSTRWLSPAGGRLARYKLLETLLRIGGDAAAGATGPRGRHRALIPGAALVIVLTPLQDPRTVETIERWRARGRSVAVVLIDVSDLVEAPSSAAERLAARLWRLELNRRKQRLTGIGVPLVHMGANEPITPIVSALRIARRAPSVRRARA